MRNQNPRNLYLDADVLAIASLTELPSQPVNMAPARAILGKQIQQIKVAAAPPAVNSASPVLVTRRALGGGQYQFRVQFIAPTKAQDPNYQGTTVLLASPNGTVRLGASGRSGPIVFNAPQSTVPGSVVVQQDNINSSSQGGNSRALIQQ